MPDALIEAEANSNLFKLYYIISSGVRTISCISTTFKGLHG